MIVSHREVNDSDSFRPPLHMVWRKELSESLKRIRTYLAEQWQAKFLCRMTDDLLTEHSIGDRQEHGLHNKTALYITW